MAAKLTTTDVEALLAMVNELRGAAQVLLGKMTLSPGGDSYEYDGSTTTADNLRDVSDEVSAWLAERDLLT